MSGADNLGFGSVFEKDVEIILDLVNCPPLYHSQSGTALLGRPLRSRCTGGSSQGEGGVAKVNNHHQSDLDEVEKQTNFNPF